MHWYLLLVGLVALERVAELVVSERNARWSVRNGGWEVGRGHYPAMAALHTALLVGCVVETEVAHRPFLPALGWVMLAVVVSTQAMRWWCIATLGRQWNTRVLIVPALRRVTSGPYRFLRHPNYFAVVVEGVALPLVHSAWITAVTFSVLNAWLLSVRIRCENAALGRLAPPGGDAGGVALQTGAQ